MATFEDIKFSKHSGFKGVHGTYTFENGITICAIAGEYAQSIPKMNLSHHSQYRGFEVLVVDSHGNTILSDIIDGSPFILSNATPDEITEVMHIIEYSDRVMSNQKK